MRQFRGLGTALVTPFRDDEVDYPALAALVRLQVAAGVDFLVPLGSTAETPCLDDDEKKRIIATFRENAPGVPLVVGAGTNSLKATLHNMSILDADAFLLVVPYYNKPTQEGMYSYFKACAEAAAKPVVLYNVPGRTGSNMLPSTTLRLAEVPGIVAVKEASGNIGQIKEILASRPEGFSVLSGNDDQTLELMEAGADGVISVVSNVDPVRMKALVDAALAGDIDRARALDKALMPLYEACFVESNPIPAKAALSLMGLCTPDMRLPLTKASPGTFDILRNILKDI